MYLKDLNLEDAKKKIRKKRINFYSKLFTVLVLVLSIGISFYAYRDDLIKSFTKGNSVNISNEEGKGKIEEKSKDEEKEIEEVFEVESTIFYTFITSVKNNKLSYTKEDIASLGEILFICTDSRLEIDIPEIVEIENKIICVKNKEEIRDKILNDITKVALLSVDDLDFDLKVIDYEGQYIFDKNIDLDQYKLKEVRKIKNNSSDPVTNFEKEKLTKIAHTGSLISPRGVQYHIETIRSGDYTHLFKEMKPLFESMDYVTSTFEAPLLGSGKPCDTCLTFIGPEAFMAGVEYSGIDLFSLAANHIMDGGDEALGRTMELLEEKNLPHIGASLNNNNEACEPYLAEVNGIKIAYIGLNDTPGYGQWAGENKSGAGNISDVEIVNDVVTKYEPNEERIKFFLGRAKALNPDYIAVIMHWGGQEYVNQALDYQEELADLLVKNGADIILGDHVHWVQEIQYLDKPNDLNTSPGAQKETYRNSDTEVIGDIERIEKEKNLTLNLDKESKLINSKAPVFYGVGNFIFDQMWSIETRQGMSIELVFYDKELISYRLHPHQLYLYDEGLVKPLRPETPEYNDTLNRIWEVSDGI